MLSNICDCVFILCILIAFIIYACRSAEKMPPGYKVLDNQTYCWEWHIEESGEWKHVTTTLWQGGKHYIRRNHSYAKYRSTNDILLLEMQEFEKDVLHKYEIV